MNNFLRFSFFIKIIFIIINTFLFLDSLEFYIGNKFLYLLFTLTISIFFLTSFNKKEIKFFEFFFSILIWLGFFFKFYICNKIIKIFPEGIGNFDYLPSSFDEVMIVSSIGIWGFFIGYYLTPKKIFKIKLNLKYLEKFYIKNNRSIIAILLFFIVFISILNFQYGFFQKGFVSNLFLGNLFRNFIAYLFMIGFGAAIAFIINYELDKKNYGIIYLSLFETFLTSFSILSRAMLFNFFPFIISYLVKINNHRLIKINIFKVLLFIIILLLLFIFSVVGSSNIRTNKNLLKSNLTETKLNINYTYLATKVEPTNNFKLIENIKKVKLEKPELLNKAKGFYNTIIDIIMYRFVGIEGIMAVQGKKNKNFALYVASFKEKYAENKVSFYDENFLGSSSSYLKSIDKFKNQHAITLPGFIAHSYYTGSYLFVFFSAVFVSIICNLLLNFIHNIFNNSIFCAFIANILSYRLIHWGFAPLNTYKLIFGIILCVITIITLNYVIKKVFSRK